MSTDTRRCLCYVLLRDNWHIVEVNTNALTLYVALFRTGDVKHYTSEYCYNEQHYILELDTWNVHKIYL